MSERHSKPSPGKSARSTVTKVVAVVVVALLGTFAIIGIVFHKSRPVGPPPHVIVQDNSASESVVWTTDNQLFQTMNVTSFFQIEGDNGTNSSFTLGVAPSAGSGPNGAEYYESIDVHGLISKSFHPTLIAIGVNNRGVNTAEFSNVGYAATYDPVPLFGWYRVNTTSNWHFWNTTFPLFLTNTLSLGTTATLQNVSKGSASSSYFFSFPMMFEINVNATYYSVSTLHYYALLEGVGGNVSAQFTVTITDHYTNWY